MLAIRNADRVFGRGEFHFHGQRDRWQSRHAAVLEVVAAAVGADRPNFADADRTTEFCFPVAGSFTERFGGRANLNGVVANQPVQLSTPSNYGCVWTNCRPLACRFRVPL